jgi:Flp pilus assembly protein TadG
MQKTNWLRCFRDNRGGALVEFALTFPLLLLLCLGTTDFGRLFFHGVTVANAAATGAFYGAQNNVNFSKFDMMANRVTEDAKNLDNVTAGRYPRPDGNEAVLVRGLAAQFFPRPAINFTPKSLI